VPRIEGVGNGIALNRTRTRDEILKRLEVYVGINWKSHYRATFSRLLDQKRGGDSVGYPTAPAGLTWNWPAFLFIGVWCLWRRVWVGFFGVWFVYTILNADAAMANSPDRGAIPLLLMFGVSVLFGLLGDRMFFDKAYKKVLSDIESGIPLESPPKGKLKQRL